jgi:hypothetical protein
MSKDDNQDRFATSDPDEIVVLPDDADEEEAEEE